MNEKSLIPSIRFAGFTDAWERRKLGDLAEFRRGLTYSPRDISTSGIRVLRSSNIDEDSFVLAEDDVYVKETAVCIPLVEKGDILITAANGSSRLVGKHALIIDDKGKMVHGGFMLLAHPYTHSAFVNALMHAPWYSSFIRTNVAGGNGAIGNLNKSDLEEQDIAATSEQEQERIGSLFASLDHLITLHQRKYEKLLNIKKSMLDKMFPKNGELFPEVRFAGFTDAWERQKLGDLVESVPFKQYIASPEPDGKFEIIQQGSEPIIGYGNGIPCEDYAKITIFGDHTVSIYKPQKPFFVATDGTRLLTARVLDGDFLYFLLERYKPIPEGYKRHYTILIERYGCFPSHREQKLIAIFFRNIDHLITLHQRKLEKLQNIKKACLEKMFV